MDEVKYTKLFDFAYVIMSNCLGTYGMNGDEI